MVIQFAAAKFFQQFVFIFIKQFFLQQRTSTLLAPAIAAAIPTRG